MRWRCRGLIALVQEFDGQPPEVSMYDTEYLYSLVGIGDVNIRLQNCGQTPYCHERSENAIFRNKSDCSGTDIE